MSVFLLFAFSLQVVPFSEVSLRSYLVYGPFLGALQKPSFSLVAKVGLLNDDKLKSWVSRVPRTLDGQILDDTDTPVLRISGQSSTVLG